MYFGLNWKTVSEERCSRLSELRAKYDYHIIYYYIYFMIYYFLFLLLSTIAIAKSLCDVSMTHSH